MDVDFGPSKKIKKFRNFLSKYLDKSICLKHGLLFLRAGFCPNTGVADNTGAVAVQWQITLAVADNISIFRAVLATPLRIIKKQICLISFFQ